MNVKELVIIGEKEIGKTTLANALIGWDIFPRCITGGIWRDCYVVEKKKNLE